MKPKLHAVAPPKRPPYSLIRKAVALFRSDLVPRSVRRHNARAWLRSVTLLGDKHVYRGGEVKWGHQTKGIRK